MRFADWEKRLDKFISCPRVFHWGKCNCLSFAFEWVKSATGVDHTAQFLPDVDTAPAAWRFLRRQGFADTEDAADQLLTPRESVLYAARGDIVAYPDGEGITALGVCLGSKSAFLRRPKGLIFIPTTDCDRAWKVE